MARLAELTALSFVGQKDGSVSQGLEFVVFFVVETQNSKKQTILHNIYLDRGVA